MQTIERRSFLVLALAGCRCGYLVRPAEARDGSRWCGRARTGEHYAVGVRSTDCKVQKWFQRMPSDGRSAGSQEIEQSAEKSRFEPQGLKPAMKDWDLPQR